MCGGDLATATASAEDDEVCGRQQILNYYNGREKGTASTRFPARYYCIWKRVTLTSLIISNSMNVLINIITVALYNFIN